jgi:DNA-binding NarL/FixJ family response regulator
VRTDDEEPAPVRTAVVIAAERLVGRALEAAIAHRFFVVHVAGTQSEAERVLERERPHLSVVVVDPPFGESSLRDTCTRLVAGHPMTRALLLFRQPRSADVMAACQLGAQGLFDTTIGTDQLLHGLGRVAGGEVAIQPAILREMMNGEPPDKSESNGHLPLTATQERALTLLADGHTSREIATSMHLSTAAVNHTLERAAQRLGARHRAESVAMAFRRGLIT